MRARHVCQSWVYLYNGAAGGVMTTTLDDVTKKIKAEPLAEHPAEKTLLTESVGEVAWCRRTGPGAIVGGQEGIASQIEAFFDVGTGWLMPAGRLCRGATGWGGN